MSEPRCLAIVSKPYNFWTGPASGPQTAWNYRHCGRPVGDSEEWCEEHLGYVALFHDDGADGEREGG